MDKKLVILGSRGIPAKHGGFETFIARLAPYMVEQGWQVTVYCQSDDINDNNKIDMWHGIKRVHIAPNIGGAAGTIVFDCLAMKHALQFEQGVLFTVGYNTGFLNLVPRLLKRKQIINMDGIEWRRGKWSFMAKVFFYINYFFVGWSGDALIADHPEIAHLLAKSFPIKKIKTIAYGADPIKQADAAILDRYQLKPNDYGLIIARPEPENNILEIVAAWSKTSRNRPLIVLGNLQDSNDYHRAIKSAASNEVLFLGAIYDEEVVKALRFYACVYMHGHSVGGTNPSLVEALGARNAVIAHDNVFNRWVAKDAGLYFKDQSELELLLDEDLPEREKMRMHAHDRHRQLFEWSLILQNYEDLFKEMIS